MKLLTISFSTAAILSSPVFSFQHSPQTPIKRNDFLTNTATAASALTTSLILTTPASPAIARGRASLENAYDRYVPRNNEGGKFYKSQLYAALAKGDWKALSAATQEPPKKSKEDRTLQDGGIAKRAAQAGGFSDSRVLSAMDLFAATFSDSSISPKQKRCKPR